MNRYLNRFGGILAAGLLCGQSQERGPELSRVHIVDLGFLLIMHNRTAVRILNAIA